MSGVRLTDAEIEAMTLELRRHAAGHAGGDRGVRLAPAPTALPDRVRLRVLLICDAWFDVLTSQPGADFLQALGSALLLELPLAFVLIAGPLRLMRHVAIRHGLIEPGTRVWRMPIPMPELWPERSVPPS